MHGKAVCSFILLMSFVSKSFAIYCYYCNSANNSACLDINKYEEELRSRIIPIVNCETAIPRSIAVSFFCRKIVQTIFHPHKDSEVRVTRGCGWIRNKDKDCYKDDNSDHLGTVCQCFGDMCNGGEKFHPPYITLLLLSSLYWLI
ncbi:uncharacterized protein [Epargyreus clarus]|uniref:uncharacterized protein n=1 Tax=Epargyreus clarus TaxID=520877 RepID=UPI003C2F6D77